MKADEELTYSSSYDFFRAVPPPFTEPCPGPETCERSALPFLAPSLAPPKVFLVLLRERDPLAHAGPSPKSSLRPLCLMVHHSTWTASPTSLPSRRSPARFLLMVLQEDFMLIVSRPVVAKDFSYFRIYSLLRFSSVQKLLGSEATVAPLPLPRNLRTPALEVFRRLSADESCATHRHLIQAYHLTKGPSDCYSRSAPPPFRSII